MAKRLNAKIILRDGYGTVVNSPIQRISFDDTCPICSASGLTVKENRYCADGEFYFTDNIYCKNGCSFKYANLVNLQGFKKHD